MRPSAGFFLFNLIFGQGFLQENVYNSSGKDRLVCFDFCHGQMVMIVRSIATLLVFGQETTGILKNNKKQ